MYASVYLRHIYYWREKEINLRYQNTSSSDLKHSVHLTSEFFR